MKRAVIVLLGLVASAAGFVAWWRRHPRFGTATVNQVINPWLVQQGMTEATHGEIVLLEHVGRVSGVVRVTPVRAVDTEHGIRIVMPLGSASQWGQNVVAAGHCRLQRGEQVVELDTPQIVDPRAVESVPPMAAAVMAWLGFRYLTLRRFAEHRGTLDQTAERAEPPAAEPDRPEPAPIA